MSGHLRPDYTSLKEFMEQGIPFNSFLGMRVRLLEHGHARLLLPFRKEFIGDSRRPALHGGLISTLVDTCGGLAAWTCCAPDDKIATVDMRVDYLLPGPAADIEARAHVERLGNRVAVVSCLVLPAQGEEKTIAVGRAVYNIRRVADMG